VSITAGHLVWTIFKGPLEAVVGILYGIIFGIILWYIPHSEHVSCILVITYLHTTDLFIIALLVLFRRKLHKIFYSVHVKFV